MENQRIRLSKTMLKEALINLLKVKSIEKISIYELCSKAQINRTTFYKYYGNQHDLLTDIENDLFNQIENQLVKSNDENVLKHLLGIILADKENFLTLINVISDQEFSSKLFSLHMIETLLTAQIPSKYTDRQKEYMYLFICQGSYAIIRKWLNEKAIDSTEMIAKMIYSYANKILD